MDRMRTSGGQMLRQVVALYTAQMHAKVAMQHVSNCSYVTWRVPFLTSAQCQYMHHNLKMRHWFLASVTLSALPDGTEVPCVQGREGAQTHLLNGHSTGLRHQEQGEEDANELPGSEEDVDAPLQRAQHVQKSCTQDHHQSGSNNCWALLREAQQTTAC